MRAVVFRAFGDASVLELDPQHPRPRFAVKLPQILGGDVASVVEEADAGSAFKRGCRVFGCTGQQEFWNKWGTYAEYVSAPEATLALIPDGVDFQAAAAVPLAAMTAWQALAPAMPLKGKRVLVHAGAGGVGHFAVQIAKAQGAHVTTTCGARNVEFVTATLGADVAVDYGKRRFEDEARDKGKFQIIVDLVGGSHETRSLPLVARGGHFTEVLNSGWMHDKGPALGPVFLMWHTLKGLSLSATRLGPSYSFLVMKPGRDLGLRQLAELLAARKLVPHVERVEPLERAAEAHAHVEGGHARGKTVLAVVAAASD